MGDEYLTNRAGDAVVRIPARSGDLREVLDIVDRLFDGSAEVGVPTHWKHNFTLRKVAEVGSGVKVFVSLNTQEMHYQLTANGAAESYFSNYAPQVESWDDIVKLAREQLRKSLEVEA